MFYIHYIGLKQVKCSSYECVSRWRLPSYRNVNPPVSVCMSAKIPFNGVFLCMPTVNRSPRWFNTGPTCSYASFLFDIAKLSCAFYPQLNRCGCDGKYALGLRLGLRAGEYFRPVLCRLSVGCIISMLSQQRPKHICVFVYIEGRNV